jgi:lysophospholipase L1-like esterase
VVQAVFEMSLKLLAAPLLIWQGLGVRKHALILPEPTGPRSGVTAKRSSPNAPLRLLIVGDSAAAGVGVDTQDDALLGQLVQTLSQHTTVEWDLIARTGATTASTTTWLRDTQAKPYDAVVISLGVNDVTRQIPLQRWINQTATLLDLLVSKFSAKRIYTTTLPPMGEFPVLPQPLRWIIGLRVDRFDTAMARYQSTRPEVTRLHPDYPMGPTLMASDGYHPSKQAYTIWADLMAKAILEDIEGLGQKRLAKI